MGCGVSQSYREVSSPTPGLVHRCVGVLLHIGAVRALYTIHTGLAPRLDRVSGTSGHVPDPPPGNRAFVPWSAVPADRHGRRWAGRPHPGREGWGGGRPHAVAAGGGGGHRGRHRRVGGGCGGRQRHVVPGESVDVPLGPQNACVCRPGPEISAFDAQWAKLFLPQRFYFRYVLRASEAAE